MTRINADLDPRLLHRRHLVAELREITMVPAALRRSLRTKSEQDVLKSIPSSFTLGSGHVKFFFNKMLFLKLRFFRLCKEMQNRGYAPDWSRVKAFDNFSVLFYNDWVGSEVDRDIVLQRIEMRKQEKPHLYEI